MEGKYHLLRLIVMTVLVCVLLLPAIEEGEAALPTAPGTEVNGQIELPDQSKTFGWMIVQLIFYTVLIIILIVLFIRFLARRQQKLGHQQLFEHMGGTSLGPHKSLQLIKVGGKIYLLGVSDQITLIKEIDDPAQIERIEADREKQQSFFQATGQGGWKSLLDQWANKKRDSQFQSLLETSLRKQQLKREKYERDLRQGQSGPRSDVENKEG
ncbi:flagellar biosynthetic protein FliO [Caldalkalibacillus thermarum TA2.A1]|uniref:Flagellar biosynthetic protein FliO n=1 Tax=Caldalkalibacillus thermarum (strain TA2.A1) TaxID=986075 RepID=F5L804_CALTT|nr:flagellar biosynthetic protein FliO [Caldalkalibacillus thermarum]EGL82512.1 flagellar biosynthetic protein FliO [Caldalkalibacillus thermarum TA2.A1]QZT33010.1 flagellar biosynthetic protein FliO [Caldalkalibacillus thermarum TA2.A1]